MKYTNRTIAKAFASGEFATRKTSSGTMFTEGCRIYSYGHHYLIAYLDVATHTAYVNTRKYSQTTSCQVSVVISALCREGWTIEREEFGDRYEPQGV